MRSPLERARENIKSHGLEEKIQTRLSDGVQALEPGEAQSLVIAGMGGSLVIRILQEGPAVLEAAEEVILQPQSDIWKVRRFLAETGYRIAEERMVMEDGKFYPMMRAVHGDSGEMSDIDYLYYPRLLEEKDACLGLFLEKEEQTLEKLREGLWASGTEKARERLLEIEEKYQRLKSAKERIS